MEAIDLSLQYTVGAICLPASLIPPLPRLRVAGAPLGTVTAQLGDGLCSPGLSPLPENLKFLPYVHFQLFAHPHFPITRLRPPNPASRLVYW